MTDRTPAADYQAAKRISHTLRELLDRLAANEPHETQLTEHIRQAEYHMYYALSFLERRAETARILSRARR